MNGQSCSYFKNMRLRGYTRLHAGDRPTWWFGSAIELQLGQVSVTNQSLSLSVAFVCIFLYVEVMNNEMAGTDYRR